MYWQVRQHAHRKSHRLQHSEIVAIVDILEQKGLCSKQVLFEIMNELRRKNPNESESGAYLDAEGMIGRGRRSNGLLPPPHQLSRVFYFVTRISTRRFFARPAGVVFGSTGLLSA